MSNGTKDNRMLLGALIGGAVGAIATLLLTPKTGAQMREDISNTYQSICTKTKDLASQVGSTTKDLVAQVGLTTKEVADTVKEEAVNLAQHAKQSGQNIKETAASAINDK